MAKMPKEFSIGTSQKVPILHNQICAGKKERKGHLCPPATKNRAERKEKRDNWSALFRFTQSQNSSKMQIWHCAQIPLRPFDPPSISLLSGRKSQTLWQNAKFRGLCVGEIMT